MAHAGIIDIEKLNRAIDEIQNAIHGAVPVIRCKDCKHWKLLESSETIGTCWMFARYPLADSFCDKAERKEE